MTSLYIYRYILKTICLFFLCVIGLKMCVKEGHYPHFVYCCGEISHTFGFRVLLIVTKHVYVRGIS